MQLVIKIPEHYYENNIKKELPICLTEEQVVCILPKNHGRLIDEKDVIENICEAHGCYGHNNCKSKLDNFCGAWDVVENAPTIIEADKSGKEMSKIDCNKTACNNCTNHNYCDYENKAERRLKDESVYTG